MSPMPRRARVAHVSTFPPLRCGIASFASDLIGAVPELEHTRYVLHYGDATSVEGHANANANSTEALVELAKLISSSDCDVVSLQHEFGIWGGREGENIHSFLDNLTKPFLSVLHTTFGPGVRSQVQVDIIRRLVIQSKCVVVLTEAAKRSLEKLLGGGIKNLVIVPHGIPAVPFVAPPPWKTGSGKQQAPLCLITPGFFRPDKGFELILQALRRLRDDGYFMRWSIVGESQQQFGQQASYRDRVENLIDALGLRPIVRTDCRYLSVTEQATAIQSAHLGIFAYQDPSHASSGTVPLVLGMGRPVLCTPFEYACAKAQEGRGVALCAGFDSASIARALERFIHERGCLREAKETYKRTRSWVWPEVGKVFAGLYLNCT